MRALQQAALPEIKAMLQANPLSTYAAWSPRQIAGSNPAYDQLFTQAANMGPALGGLNLIFGDGQTGAGGGGMSIPSMGGVAPITNVGPNMGGQGNTVPPPPPNYQPMNIQSIIQQQVANAAANQATPSPNSIQGNTYYDAYGTPHPFDSINGLTGMPGYSLGPNPTNTGWQVIDPNGSMIATS